MRGGLARVVETIGTALGIIALLAIGFVSSADIWTVAIAPLFIRIHIVEGLVSLGLFSVVVAVTGALLVFDVWTGEESANAPTTGPAVQAIVPAYGDAGVVDRSVTSLLENDYDPLRIAVVVEPNDRPTYDRAGELASRHETVERVVNEIPGAKATAINTAVKRSPADYFVVFDADEQASSEFVSTAMSVLRDDADVFQGRRVPQPDGPVETLAYCERVVVQAGYLISELVGFTHSQSSATGFTREAFDAVGGFADVLTEDIYFSHQCHRANLTVTSNRRCTSRMEAPHTLRDLWGQRKRWRVGHVQVSHLRVREALIDDRDLSDIVTVGRAIGTVLAGGALLVLAAHTLFLVLINELAVLIPVACIFGMIGGIWAFDALDGTIGRPSWTILFAPLVYLGHGVLTVKALHEYVLTWDGEWYQVTKTEA